MEPSRKKKTQTQAQIKKKKRRRSSKQADAHRNKHRNMHIQTEYRYFLSNTINRYRGLLDCAHDTSVRGGKIQAPHQTSQTNVFKKKKESINTFAACNISFFLLF